MSAGINNGFSAGETAPIRVLVADDDPVLRRVAASKLPRGRFVVTEAADSAQAWQLLTSESFDLAVVDLSMPRIDGFRLIAHVRATPRTRHMPIIVVTSRDDTAAIDEAFGLGAHSFLTKPINWSLFPRHVNYVLHTAKTIEDLRRSQQRAEAGNRIKEEFVKTLAGELRTPVRIMADLVASLARLTGDETSLRQREAIAGRLTDISRHMTTMTDNVALFARISGGELTLREAEVSLPQLVSALVSKLKLDAGRDSEPLDIQQGLVKIMLRCDPELLQLCFRNLLEDAVKVMDGQVSLVSRLSYDGSLVLFFSGAPLSSMLDQVPAPRDDVNCGNRLGSGPALRRSITRAVCKAHGGRLSFGQDVGKPPFARIVIPAARVRINAVAAT